MQSILQPAYQPIFDLRQRRISHYEALARVRHDHTSLGHRPLIELAERFRFIHAIDLAMLELVMADAACHRATIAVNLSLHTIAQAPYDILSRLESKPAMSRRLIFEFTETGTVKDERIVLNFIRLLRALDVRIAIDDFGAGVFTAAMVRSFRPDFLKLDGLVLGRAMASGVFDEVEAAIQLGRACGSEIIAEFVDSPAKIEALNALGIRLAQGESFGMPRRRIVPVSARVRASNVVAFPLVAP